MALGEYHGSKLPVIGARNTQAGDDEIPGSKYSNQALDIGGTTS